MSEDLLVVGEPGGDGALLEGSVVSAEGVAVEVGEEPVLGVDGDGGDAVAAAGEEGLGGAAGLEVGAGIEKGWRR